ncbi:PIN domain-containing protein [Variovorax sp. KK3]|uniref:PIN domain-containing protein n=1 Tax=Variovorax sp. KK3 TaxID=1855728 RepID=UPI001C4DEFB9
MYKRAGNCLARLGEHDDDDIAISSINLFELRFGIAKSTNRAQMEAYVNALRERYAILDFDEVASRHGAAIRAQLQSRGTPIGPYDILIAAVALAHDLTIVTRNTREFLRVPRLRVDNWHD